MEKYIRDNMTSRLEEMAKEKERKVSIHNPSDYDNLLSIYSIEKFLHPRADQNLREELTTNLSEFYKRYESAQKSKSTNTEVLADEFMKILAEAHFGRDFMQKYNLKDENERNRIFNTLSQAFGVDRKSIRDALDRGAYENLEDFLSQQRDDILRSHQQFRQQKVGQTLQEYTQDENYKAELVEHLEDRTGHKLEDKYKRSINPRDALRLISAYMSIPGAAKVIGKKSSTAANLPEDLAGTPGVGKGVFENYGKLNKIYKNQLADLRSGEPKDRTINQLDKYRQRERQLKALQKVQEDKYLP